MNVKLILVIAIIILVIICHSLHCTSYRPTCQYIVVFVIVKVIIILASLFVTIVAIKLVVVTLAIGILQFLSSSTCHRHLYSL